MTEKIPQQERFIEGTSSLPPPTERGSERFSWEKLTVRLVVGSGAAMIGVFSGVMIVGILRRISDMGVFGK